VANAGAPVEGKGLEQTNRAFPGVHRPGDRVPSPKLMVFKYTEAHVLCSPGACTCTVVTDLTERKRPDTDVRLIQLLF